MTKVDRTIAIPPGEYEAFQLDFEDDASFVKYSVIVKRSGKIDIFVLPPREYTKYVKDDDFEINLSSGPSETPTAEATNEFSLDDEGWVLVLDHTNRLGFVNDEVVQVELNYRFRIMSLLGHSAVQLYR